MLDSTVTMDDLEQQAILREDFAAAAGSELSSTKPHRPKGCSACGRVANLRDLDPELVKRSRTLAAQKKRSRSLGYLKSDERPRK